MGEVKQTPYEAPAMVVVELGSNDVVYTSDGTIGTDNELNETWSGYY